MDRASIRALIALDNRFYRAHAASFSATRQAPWQGWARVAALARERLLPEMGQQAAGSFVPDTDTGAGAEGETAPGTGLPPELSVVDVACGNMRLAPYLAAELAPARVRYAGIDSCPALAGEGSALAAAVLPENLATGFIELDILDAVLGRGPRSIANALERPADLVCCLGFMHHVPGAALRQAVLAGIVGALRPHGLAVVSFWQFMDDARLAAKADAAHALNLAREAGIVLEEGDHLLGWQDDGQAVRYCHHVTETEIDALAADVSDSAREICRFSADGRSGRLNRYLVLERIR